MKRLFVAVAAFALAAGIASAQDFNAAVETFNNGAQTLESNKADALTQFKSALAQFEACTEDEAADMVAQCKKIIPQTILSIAKEQINEANYDEALETLKEAAAVAEGYGIEEIAADAKELAAYRQAFAAYHEAEQQLAELKAAIERNRENVDFLQFQHQELADARLADGEQEELEQKSETMTHAEDIKSALYMDTTYIELKDVAQEVSSRLENVDFDPAELDSINDRLDRLYDLEKKYHVETVAELIAKRDELQQQLSAIDNSEEAVETQQARCRELQKRCQEQADVLTAMRAKAAKAIEKDMLSRLVPLGMPNVRFAIQIERAALAAGGQDRVQFLFSANTSTPLQPVAMVASGGEIARVMLSLKAMISGAVKLPTIIFDEIDTGVSGKIAEQMARMMREMGEADRQVISITHLPQIAALGTSHYKVAKRETDKGTASSMTELSADERVTEIAQMLSGSDITAAAMENARQLLKN